MASEKPEDPMNNTAGMGTDEETIAQRRKRLRRVSFADREITSVHIFNRDEDYETPPNSSAEKLQNGEQADTSESEDKVIRFFGELSDREDTAEGDGEGEFEAILDKSFLRPKYSPSSGGSTVGSATADDEDNFFGPVSSHFINPGRLSDTTISEDHHDITMDSTAFSMHFRSLARSESGDVRTPTSSHLPVEEKTPTQVTSRSDTGSAMVLTMPKKLFPRSPLPVEKGSGGRDSNDMSIVGENSRKYDYGYISPTLAALLADESKELLPEDNAVVARSPIHDFSSSPQNGCIPVGQACKDSHGIDSSDASQVLSPSGSGCHPQIVLQELGSQRYTKEASLSSSTIRRQSAFLVGILPQSLSCVTPSPKQGGSFMSRETRALVESLSTIQKSKSRLGLIPPSPGSALSQRIQKSKLQLSGYRSMTTPTTIGREEIGVHREKHADIPITNLEGLLSKHDNRTPISEKKGVPDKCSSGALSPAVDIIDDNRTAISEKKGMPDQCSSGAFSPAVDNSDGNRTPVSEKKGVPDKCSSGALSPAVDTSDGNKTPVSEKKGMPDQCSSGALSSAVDTSDDRTPVSETKGIPDQHCCGALSPAVDISDVFARRSPEGTTNSELKGSLFKQQRRNQTASTPEKFVSSLKNSSNAKTSASKNLVTLQDQEQKGMPDQSSSGALSPAVDTSDDRTPVSETKGIPDQHRCGALSPAIDISDVFARRSPEGTTNSELKGSLFKQQRRNQTASTPERFVSSLTNSSNVKTSASKNLVTLQDQEQHSKAIDKSDSEAGDGIVTKERASNYSMNTLSGKVDSLLAESSVLLSETGFLNGSVQQKEKDSMLNKNQNRTNISAAQFLLKDNNHFKVHCETEVISAEDFPAVVTENLPGTSGSSYMDRSKNEASHDKEPSRLKRKAEDVDCAVRNCSPKVGRSTQYISKSVMDHPDGNFDANDCRRVCGQVMNWVEIPGKVSEDINQMLTPLADKLNFRLICKLEDILTHMKKVHLCEMLCLQIQSQKVCDDLGGAKTKRRAENRTLLCKLAHEKAKLELLHLKKEIMMKKFQAVSTGVQTSEILRLNGDKLLRQHGFHSTGLLNPEQAHEVTNTKGAEITQEIKVLDSKIKNLIQCFPTCNTMTGQPADADTIVISEDNLKKRMSCRSIRQDILVWKVESLGERNNCQSIVLNYSGLINQRLTLKPGHPSCVLVSNSLSDSFIKNFPDLNVSIAFNSLFNAEDSQKYVGGSNILLEITQKTSLLLHNLLDVAEEFQLARMNVPNLVQGSFDSPSAEQLHLQITFIDCKNLRKLIVILNVTSLIHGKYPGDVVPCELREVSGTKRDGVVSKQLENEIESAIDDVELGYPRILRLCRCISKVLQSQRR